jgi:hypothetical protein
LASDRNRRGPLLNCLCVQDCGKAEVVALELWIPHLAVVAEVDAIKAAAETLDVTVRELRGELREHRAPQLEPFVDEVVAVSRAISPGGFEAGSPVLDFVAPKRNLYSKDLLACLTR